MSSSLGENLTQPGMILKGAAGGPTEPRQVLGNVGNAGQTLHHQMLHQKKEQFLQELRKDIKIKTEAKAVTTTASHAEFLIYTDSNSPQAKIKQEEEAGRIYAAEDSENLPPSNAAVAASKATTSSSDESQRFPPVAVVPPIQPRCPLEDRSRTPFAEICEARAATSDAALVPRDLLFDVPDYQADILEYLKEAEVRFRPKSDYMRKQPDINGNMRTVLVDWIVEVCEEYRLNTETLFLAVSYVDRFLSLMSVVRSKLQLVGTSAMFIAAKLEEIYPPDVADFVYITDDTYTKKQVLRMEQLILRALCFDMSAPTPHVFVNLFAVMEDLPDTVRHLALYLCELSLLYCTPFLQYLPSRVAAAALAYARLLVSHEGRMWTRAMELATGYELGHLQQVICELGAVHEKCPQMVQKAIPEKYMAAKYSEVALIEAVELTEEMFARTYAAIAKELEEAVKGRTV